MNNDKNWLDRIFDVVVNVLIDVLSVLSRGLLIGATALVVYELYDAIVLWERGALHHVAINIFTVLVFIEVMLLFRNFRHGAGVPM